ncbi:glucose-1-phosphate cytidylyltransferase [Roseomonas sp. OT10]|uniref:glucose-1-phosphate cytidylyltransferase n=1 Tax=Roseomonas cutis TaxID=2897332 RepID=UPI001E58DD58|nr:glucose-1-phosphate cytidylyltransferase [Roseomonas sp. OT10]UFN49763.1 glucose-1-phosphate cytidylyltransferase [Roseomonas sp. OT10]
MSDGRAPARDIPVVILCGGEGTRFHEESQYRPKPLAEIGGWPILCHIMNLYARHGFKRFVLCLGYKGQMIKDFFLQYEPRLRDFALRLDEGTPRYLDARQKDDWDISFVDTGAKTQTGGRVKRVQRHVGEVEHFMLTYGDGVSDIDIGALLDFHLAHGAIGTVTGVVPNSQFGVLGVEGDRVRAFAEKPRTTAVINGGFFVFRREFFDYLDADEGCILEREPLSRLAADGGLRVRRHDGFWQCMDTFKDYRQLNEIWATGEAPWSTRALP